MIKNKQLVEKYYERDSIVKTLTSYILYYQVALGHNVHETIQDPEDTIKKIKELNLTLEPNEIMIAILEIILQYSNQDNFDNNFEKYIKNRALLHSLKDFIDNDKELINGNRIQEYKIKEILEDKFFNGNLKMQYLSEYANMYKYYDNIIDDDYALNVKKIMLENLTNR